MNTREIQQFVEDNIKSMHKDAKVYMIFIDLNSIKENPNASKRDYIHPGQITYILNGKDISEEELKQKQKIYMEQYSKLKTDQEKQKFVKKNPFISEQSRNLIETDSLNPEPKYLYEYINQEVECKKCKQKFSFEELQSDYITLGNDGETFSDEVCPKCGEWWCVVIQYETIEQALDEKKGETNENKKVCSKRWSGA